MTSDIIAPLTTYSKSDRGREREREEKEVDSVSMYAYFNG